MRVLICGGRDFIGVGHIELALRRTTPTPTLVITGGARGADTYADRVAEMLGIPRMIFPANWNGDGPRAAGPIRNQRMIDEGRPDLVIAFPGGSGTADMLRRARKAGIKVEEPLGGGQSND